MELIRFGDNSEKRIKDKTFKGILFVGESAVQDPSAALWLTDIQVIRRTLAGKKVIAEGPLYLLGQLCNERDSWYKDNVWISNAGFTKTWLKFELKKGILVGAGESISFKLKWWPAYTDLKVTVNWRNIIDTDPVFYGVDLKTGYFRALITEANIEVKNFRRFRFTCGDYVKMIQFNNGKVIKEISGDELMLLYNTTGCFGYDAVEKSMKIKIQLDGVHNTTNSHAYMIDGEITKFEEVK